MRSESQHDLPTSAGWTRGSGPDQIWGVLASSATADRTGASSTYEEGRKQLELTSPLLSPLPFPSCIAFTLNLANAHKLDISKAYAIATAQFSHLRAIQEIAVRAANREAEAYGGTFAGGELVRRLLFPSSHSDWLGSSLARLQAV